MSTTEKKARTLTGIVISDKMNKSRVVVIEGLKKHPTYGKYLKTRRKFMAHDAENKTKRGNRVLMRETVPLSSRKRWEIVEILGFVGVKEEESDGRAGN